MVCCPNWIIFSNGIVEKDIDSIYKRRYTYNVDVSGTGIPPPMASNNRPAEGQGLALRVTL